MARCDNGDDRYGDFNYNKTNGFSPDTAPLGNFFTGDPGFPSNDGLFHNGINHWTHKVDGNGQIHRQYMRQDHQGKWQPWYSQPTGRYQQYL